MKKVIIIVILIMGYQTCFSQPHKTLQQLLNLANEGKSYTVKFQSDLKPYIEVDFKNYFKGKTITTFVFTYDYEIPLNGVNEIYEKSKIVKHIVKSNTTGNIRIELKNDELKGYYTPNDIKVTTVVINNLRFSDGTVYNKNIGIESKN